MRLVLATGGKAGNCGHCKRRRSELKKPECDGPLGRSSTIALHLKKSWSWLSCACSHHVVAINQALLAGDRCAHDVACLTRWQTSAHGHSESNGGPKNGHRPTADRLSPEAVDQVRQQLRLGHRVGLEYADPRRFKAGSWQSGPILAATQEAEVLAQIEQFLAAHSGNYVRLLGIDPRAKQRQFEQVIQMPG